jgi:uncharacterized protein (TIGR01244 family)
VRLIRLDDSAIVAGQIAPGDMAEIAASGVVAIVNNRPDGEEPNQPEAAEIQASAKAAGLAYEHIPVAGGISNAQIERMAKVLGEAEGPVLAFCRSGTRSTYIWALARAQLGDEPGTLTAKARSAGFDLAPIAAFLHNR